MARFAIPFERDDLTCTYRIEVGDEHIDMMGHVNVMYYTSFFGRGFWHFFKDEILAGTPESGKYAVFMVEQHIRYLTECLCGDTIAVYPRAVGLSKKSVQMVCYLYNETRQRLSAHSEMVLLGVNLETRKASAIPKSFREKFTSVMKQHNALPWPPSTSGSMRPL